MSNKEKEKIKEEITQESTEKEKSNMKITLIPKVIIKGSLPKNELKKEIEYEKEILENQLEQKYNVEKPNEYEKKESMNEEIKNKEKEKIIGKDFQEIDINEITEITEKKNENCSEIEEITPDMLIKEAETEEIIEQSDFVEKGENVQNLEKKEKIFEKNEFNQINNIIEEKNNIQKEKPVEEVEKVNSEKMIIKENIEITPKEEPEKDKNNRDFWDINDKNEDNSKKIITTNNNNVWEEEISPNINEPKNSNTSNEDCENTNQNDNIVWGNSDEKQKNSNNDWGNNNTNNFQKNTKNIDIQKMEIEDDKDIREDIGPLPESKRAEDTFSFCFEEKEKENKMTWFNRDGRNNKNDPFIQKEMERLLKEHEDFLAKKEDKTADMESIEFKFYFVKIYSNEEPTELKDEKKPKIRFENLNRLPELLANNIKKLKFDYLTPIQRMVMPYIQIGKDIVCVAETGSGKTLAYLFPIIGQMLITGVPKNPFIQETQSNPNNNQKSSTHKNRVAFPLSLVLLPTRELAIQVSNESKKLSFNTGIRTVAVYGGEGKRNQIFELAKGCDILVATPGRLIDLVDKKLIDLRMISHLILDEADRMLDQNFYPDIRRILENIPKRKFRQNLLFSATFDDDVKGLAKFCLNNYYFFKPILESPKQIKHEFIQVFNDDDKLTKLKNYLKKDEVKDKSILIFLRTKVGVDELGRLLSEDGIKCCTIHGDKQQPERNKSIKEFISGKNNVLIATDVASRGLDFPKVYCVINFDIPQNTDDYIHRCGRTGRSGQEGIALTFIDDIDINSREKLITFLRNQNQEIPDWLKDFETGKKFRFFGSNKRRKMENEDNFNNNADPFKKPFKKKREESNGENNNSNTNNDDNNGSPWGNSTNDNNNQSYPWGGPNNSKNNNESIQLENSNNYNNESNIWGISNNDIIKENNSKDWNLKDSNNNNNSNSSWNDSNNNKNNQSLNNNDNCFNSSHDKNNNRGRGRGRSRGRGCGNDWGRGRGKNFNRNNNNDKGIANNNSDEIGDIPENSNDELFVKGIGYDSTEDELRETFNKYGEIAQIKILKDKETQKSKGSGFVKFNEIKSAVKALNDADNLICQGRNLLVKYSNDKEGELKGKKKGPRKDFNKNNKNDGFNKNNNCFQNSNNINNPLKSNNNNDNKNNFWGRTNNNDNNNSTWGKNNDISINVLGNNIDNKYNNNIPLGKSNTNNVKSALEENDTNNNVNNNWGKNDNNEENKQNNFRISNEDTEGRGRGRDRGRCNGRRNDRGGKGGREDRGRGRGRGRGRDREGRGFNRKENNERGFNNNDNNDNNSWTSHNKEPSDDFGNNNNWGNTNNKERSRSKDGNFW